jgi:hypothetical protein
VYCCTGQLAAQAVVNQLYIYIYVTVMFCMHIFIPECYQMQANARWQVSQRGVGLALVRVGLGLVQALDRPTR